MTVHAVSVATLLLSACSVFPLHERAPSRPLLSPAALGASHHALHLISGVIGEHDVRFQCVVTVEPARLTVIALGAQGQRWFTLRHDGATLSLERSPDAPEGVDPQRVLADLQLALWPLPALQAAMAGTAWDVGEPAASTRRLRHAGRLITEVHYRDPDPWQGRQWLIDVEQDYSLLIESRSLP
ncbi:MAG: hypothetical protein K0Q76_2913 [Panacagrimonas sp.]|nr:DUF3261 domain-containing protein [Panacagrimonas sp.]MCC2657805.1 hypothetical protein [Panacagrimonas sp.]